MTSTGRPPRGGRSLTRKDKAEKSMAVYVTTYNILQEPSPERALLLFFIQGLAHLSDYTSFESIRRRLPISEQGLKIQIGKLKGEGMLVEEGGFISLTSTGKGYISTLQGRESIIYARYKRKKKK